MEVSRVCELGCVVVGWCKGIGLTVVSGSSNKYVNKKAGSFPQEPQAHRYQAGPEQTSRNGNCRFSQHIGLGLKLRASSKTKCAL